MTQIFTGEGLGLHGSSLGLGKYGPKGAAGLGQGGESVYVNAANGNLVLRQNDGFLADIGFGLGLFQTYNSRGEGSAWHFNVQSRLEVNGEANTKGSSITRVDEDGHRSHYIYNAEKKCYLPEDGSTNKITFNQGNWIYHEGNQKTSCYYNGAGQLTQIRDLDGHSLLFNYENNQLSSIIDNSGKQSITWSFRNGLLQDVTTKSEGKVVHHLHYDYDAQQRLQKVSRDLGEGKTYWISYEYLGDSNLISDIRQSDGTLLHIDYDAQSRVKKLTDGEGRTSTYTYEQGSTTLTNGLGESWTYYYDSHNKLTGIDGPEQYRIRYDYEGALLSRVTLGNQIWSFKYNEAGDCIRIEESSGQITLREFNAEHQLISQTQYQIFDGERHPAKPQTTSYLYDEHGHLRFKITADGTVTECRYNNEGQLVSTRCYMQASFIATEQNTSLKNLETWVNQQNPHNITLIDYQYDWRGQLIEELHYGQVDSDGKGITSSATITRSRYDAAGRLIEQSKLINEEFCITQYLYDDLGRLIQTIDNQHNSQRFEYDDAQQRIIQTDANRLQTIQLFDRSGLLLSVMRLDTNTNYGTKLYQYDAAGQIIIQTDEQGKSNYIFYDAQGRLQAQVDANGLVTETIYNNEGLIIKTQQYYQQVNTEGWRTLLPAFTDIKPKNNKHDRITQLVYNQFGQLAYRIDAQGAVISYDYNAQDQLIASTAYYNKLADFNPENVVTFETIKLQKNSKDRLNTYYYDTLGRLEAKVNGEGYATSYTYDRLGNLLETCRFTTAIQVSYTADWSQDKPTVNPKDIHTYSLYDGRGLKIADVDGEGYLTEYRYNSQGSLIELRTYEQAVPKNLIINETTTLEQIRPKAANNDHYTRYKYNDLGLLVEEKNYAGLIINYSYDAIGNLITKTSIDEQTQALRQQMHRYDALGRIIQSLDELGAALLLKDANATPEQIELIWQQQSIKFEYDNSGLLRCKTNALNQSTHYFYDDARALRFSVNADGAVTEYSYNSFGEIAQTTAFSAYLKVNVKELTTRELGLRIISLQDTNYDEVTRYEYNTIGQMIAKYKGSHSKLSNSYNSFGELEWSRQSIDTHSNTLSTYDYDKRGLLIQNINDAEGIAQSNSVVYDAFGWMNQKIDGNHNSLSYKLNKRGEQIYIFNAANEHKSLKYDVYGRIISETDYTHTFVTKIYSYDDKNKTFTLNQDSNTIITQFNAFGDKISIIDANNAKTEFCYDEKGELIKTLAPEQVTKNFQYDASGNLIWEQTNGGQTIEYCFDAAAHLLSKTIDPDGLKLTTKYGYDAIGRQLEVTQANGVVKQFRYDDVGNLIQSCIDPGGLHLITNWIYDDRGLLLRQIDINPRGVNKETAFQWDNLGRKIAKIVDPEGLKITTRYEYDASDNIICITDANNHSTHYIYDENNRCRYEINSRNVVTEHIYDFNGNEKQTVTYAKPIAALKDYNEENLKLVLQEDPNHDSYQFQRFDKFGKLTFSCDALGYGTNYKYDANDNIISICKYATAVSIERLKEGYPPILSKENARKQFFIYDALNQLRFTCDSQGTLKEAQYDKNGQLVQSAQYSTQLIFQTESQLNIKYILNHLKYNAQADKTTRYQYDNAGRMILELSAEGIAKTYEYDALNKVIASTTYATKLSADECANFSPEQIHKSAQDRTSHFVYDAAGNERYRISSEGRVVERRYDAVGNITGQLTHATLLQLNNYNEETIKNAFATLNNQEQKAQHTNYQYDAAGRLQNQVNAEQSLTQYTYDAEGNVLSKLEGKGALWTYKYNETNQLTETTSPIINVNSTAGSQQRSIITRNSYDNFGNLIEVVRDAEGVKQITRYEYNANQQKIRTLYPNVAVNNATAAHSNQRQESNQILSEECQYNAFAELVASKDKAGNWKHFAFNEQGLLRYCVDTQSALTEYQYDNLGQLTTKIRYATALETSADFDYSCSAIHLKHQANEYDRKELYTYDREDHLIQTSSIRIRSYNAKSARYEYTEPTTKTTYNAFGEVIKTSIKIHENDWADTYTYYDNEGNQSATIDAMGYITTYTHTVFGEVESMTEHANAALNWGTTSYTLDNSSAKDRSVSYSYDLLGQLTTKSLKQVRFERLITGTNNFESHTEDLTTSYSYDSLGHLIATTDAKGNTAYCYYDNMGQVIAKVAPKTQAGRAATTYSYDALGNLVQTHIWAKGATFADEHEFHVFGNSIDDIITEQSFDTQGQLISQTDSNKHMIYYSYDANGNLARSWQTIHQIDGSTKVVDNRYCYDSEQHLLQTATYKDKDLHTEDAQYNVFGELISKGFNGQFNTHVEYDSQGRVWRSNSQGYYQIFVYDLMGNVTQVVTSTSDSSPLHGSLGIDLSTRYFEELFEYDQASWNVDLQKQNNSYDKLGRLVKQSKSSAVNPSAPGEERHLEYTSQSQKVDRWGNVLSATNALNYETRYEYNAFNQLIKQELPQVHMLDVHGVDHLINPVNLYAYDELGQAIAMLDANGHAVSKQYDALGRVIAERDASGAIRRKNYNLLDQVTESINELNGVTSYTYDKANRLIRVDTPKTHQLYEYDEAGQLIKQSNGRGENSKYFYDELGNQTIHTDARGYSTYSEYDAAGHKISELDAENHSQSWTYDEQGRLTQHRDLGGHVSNYAYNINGLLVEEHSNTGKNIKYNYKGNGSLEQYHDETYNEIINYTYDAEGQITHKRSGRGSTTNYGWLMENDHYEYDALGRLISIRRSNPDNTSDQAPNKDTALLAVDYEYDAVGNIRHTLVNANYSGNVGARVQSDDYYLYDVNDRMTLNKGQLVNGEIIITTAHGSTSSYDAAGNIKTASKYENSALENFNYVYNDDNQLELIQKNGLSLQAKFYDAAGRVDKEDSFDAKGNRSQRTILSYDKGILQAQRNLDTFDREVSNTAYLYDKVGNLTELKTHVNLLNTQPASTLTHTYNYELWDNYQQFLDSAVQTNSQGNSSGATSIRHYDANGQLSSSEDDHGINTIRYWNSSIDGMRGRQDKDGQTSYLNVGGKTIGDIRKDWSGNQILNVYGGFTPLVPHKKQSPPQNGATPNFTSLAKIF